LKLSVIFLSLYPLNDSNPLIMVLRSSCLFSSWAFIWDRPKSTRWLWSEV